MDSRELIGKFENHDFECYLEIYVGKKKRRGTGFIQYVPKEVYENTIYEKYKERLPVFTAMHNLINKGKPVTNFKIYFQYNQEG